MEKINPKAIEGRKKQTYDSIPPSFMKLMLGMRFPNILINEIASAMAEGHAKYGKMNWREDKIELMDYYNASLRHYLAWEGGEEIDPDSGLNHITKIISGLCVVYDSMYANFYKDDRDGKTLIKESDIDDSTFTSHLIDWFASDSKDCSSLIESALNLRLGDLPKVEEFFKEDIPSKNSEEEKVQELEKAYL